MDGPPEQTDRGERGGDEGNWMKEDEEVSKEHVCISHGHR